MPRPPRRRPHPDPVPPRIGLRRVLLCLVLLAAWLTVANAVAGDGGGQQEAVLTGVELAAEVALAIAVLNGW